MKLNYLKSFNDLALLESFKMPDLKEMKEVFDDVFMKYFDRYSSKSPSSGTTSKLNYLGEWVTLEKLPNSRGLNAEFAARPMYFSSRLSNFKSGRLPLYSYNINIPESLTAADLKKMIQRAYIILSEDFVIYDIRAKHIARYGQVGKSYVFIEFFNRKVKTFTLPQNVSENIESLKKIGYKPSPYDYRKYFSSKGEPLLFSKSIEIDDKARTESSRIKKRKEILVPGVAELYSILPDLKQKMTTEKIEKIIRDTKRDGTKIYLNNSVVHILFEDKLSGNQNFEHRRVGGSWISRKFSAFTITILFKAELVEKEIFLDYPDLLDYDYTSKKIFSDWIRLTPEDLKRLRENKN